MTDFTTQTFAHLIDRAREAAADHDDWLTHFSSVVKTLAQRVPELEETTRASFRDIHERIDGIRDRVIMLERTAGDGVVDVEIRCGAVYVFRDSTLGCSLPDGHPGHHIHRIFWV